MDSAPASTVDSDDLASLKQRLLLPAVLASSIGGPLIAVPTALWCVALGFFYFGPPEILPEGTASIRAVEIELMRGVLKHVALAVVGLVFLGLTWRYRGQGRQRATWLAAVGTITAGLTTFI